MGKTVGFVKCAVIQTLFFTKNRAVFSNLVQATLYSLDVDIVLLLGDAFKSIMAFSSVVLLCL